MFETVFSGESARLLCQWNGLDAVARMPFPLMGILAKPFGLTSLLAPVLGVLAAIGLFVFARHVIRCNVEGEDTTAEVGFAGRLAAIAATVVFLLSPATLSAVTCVEPALFGLVGTLLGSLALAGALGVRTALAYALVPVAGVLFGFFAGECPISSIASLFLSIVLVRTFFRRGRAARAFAALALFAFGFAVGFLVYAGIFAEDLAAALVTAKRGLLAQIALVDGGVRRAVFAVLPFLAAALILPRAFGDGIRSRRVTLAHLAFAPLVIFGLFADFEPTCVASAALVALTFGELLAYFAVSARVDYRNRPAPGVRFRNVRFVSRTLLVAVLLIAAVIALVRNVVSFDRSYAFADRLAARVLDQVGSRTWLVTDGRLDDHLRILAARRGQDLVFVNLSRDLDPRAREAVADAITRRLGARAPELLRSLDLGFLPFLEDWLKSDPTATNSVAVMAAPDVLFACGVDPVPEVFLFGADPKAPADWSVWPELDSLLAAPKGWGSFGLADERDPTARQRLDLRRSLGLVANNRGVWLQDRGDRDGAFRMYALVLDEIDADNVSALFNLLQMADDGYQPAVARASALRRRAKALVADESRRFRLWALANYHGTVRNVPALLSLGFTWARSGRPGEALAQIRRAADLIPDERRGSLMNMMAALLADADQREKSRAIYERRLAEKPDDHASLVGLVRLELLNGDETKARAYLERAVAAGGDDPRVQIELALLAMMKGDASHAREVLRAVTASDPGNVKAWSLLAAVTMQLSDTTKDAAARAALDRELEEKILPTIQTHARGADSYYVHSARAFLAMRKGEAGRKAARESLIAAVQSRPDVPVTREMLIGLDVAMNDPVAAESHARATLRQDRNSPMANYVMGSLALGKDDLVAAEAYLRKAVNVKKPSGFALNDLAETLRLAGRPAEAEPFARRVVRDYPTLYAGWDTLAAVILDRGGDGAEALAAATKAVELVTKDGRAQDAGVLLTLARAQAVAVDRRIFNMTMRKLEARLDELNDRQRALYETLRREGVKATPRKPSLADAVDPLIGTEGVGTEYGGMMPMTGVPFGSMQLVPMTRTNAVSRTSFNKLDKELLGFILTRQPAIWMGEWGAVRILLPKPLAIESLDAHPWKTVVRAGGRTYELVATSHAAAIRSDDPTLGADLPAVGFSTEKMDDYYGVRTPNFKAWFVRERVGDTLRIGVSLLSADDARRNLAEEMPGDVDAAAAAGRKVWEERLSRIEIETPSADIRTIFATALYHAVHYPRETTERGRYWSAFDDRVHAGVGYTCFSLWDTYRSEHALLTLLAPDRVDGMMQALVSSAQEGGWLPKWPNPGYTGTMVGAPAEMVLAEAWAKGFRGFDLQAAYAAVKKNATVPQEGDATKRWPSARASSFGPPETRGGLTFYQTLGYVPIDKANESVSRTQDFALDDTACAVLADAAGFPKDAAYFRDRSHSWTNLWNASAGQFWPRLSTGAFKDPEPDPVTKKLDYDWPYTECSKETATWCVPHDVERLIALLGGNEAFVRKLDAYFDGPFFRRDTSVYGNFSLHGNESGHHVAYLYNFAGRPDRTQLRVRQILTRCYHASGRGFDGNEDCGAMSAWYVLSALGLYPLNPCTGRYELGSPLVDRAVIRIGAPFKPAVFTIVAKNQSPANGRVRRVTLNGKPVEGHSIAHADIVKGGELVFEMAPFDDASPVR